MKIYILLADGFEDIEAISAADILRRAGGEVILLSITDSLLVESSSNITVSADAKLKDHKDQLADMVILPGGEQGAYRLRESDMVRKFLNAHQKNNKYIAAICAAPIALDTAGILENHAYTCYPGFEKAIASGQHQNDRIVIDNYVITGKGPGVALEFAFMLTELLFGKAVADGLRQGMLANNC